MKLSLSRNQLNDIANGFEIQLAIPSPQFTNTPRDLRSWLVEEYGVQPSLLRFVTTDEIVCKHRKNSRYIGEMVDCWDKYTICFCVPVVRFHLTASQDSRPIRKPLEWASLVGKN